ncbi:alpha/beta hydrolase [Saccharobesus litoralis]|uniref:Alpha/beta hydrolase n=1 Tax=Saccharobesus litoralis TaxID=2172099 RepID=A0A2S0VTR9_9ALTE|nr:alpha/beta fold hydrolase [Saccharobesus litoralis]AWB67614.1 alpha/beta hydrolase [Saccharobesus litoralis]
MAQNNEQIVVLLHGLARSAMSLLPMELALRHAGFTVININYPSTDHSIDELTQRFVWPKLNALIQQKCALNFVCHSMGGILVRNLAHLHSECLINKVVMLSPPNKGSELVDLFADWRLFQMINGPAGSELGTTLASKPNSLGPVNFNLGVITGDLSLNPILEKLFNGPNDGKVSVERAKIEGMKDFLVVNASHTFIMNNLKVIENTIHFLQNGEFIDHTVD